MYKENNIFVIIGKSKERTKTLHILGSFTLAILFYFVFFFFFMLFVKNILFQKLNLVKEYEQFTFKFWKYGIFILLFYLDYFLNFPKV